jgi:hypothetical protein
MQQHMLVAIRQASQRMLIMGRLVFMACTLPLFANAVKSNCERRATIYERYNDSLRFRSRNIHH